MAVIFVVVTILNLLLTLIKFSVIIIILKNVEENLNNVKI